MTATHFVYKLLPPRPTFVLDMADDEQAMMGQHASYWSELFDQGRVAVFGAVLDPSSPWGLAVVEADSVEAVQALAEGDPVGPLADVHLRRFSHGQPDRAAGEALVASTTRRRALGSNR